MLSNLIGIIIQYPFLVRTTGTTGTINAIRDKMLFYEDYISDDYKNHYHHEVLATTQYLTTRTQVMGICFDVNIGGVFIGMIGLYYIRTRFKAGLQSQQKPTDQTVKGLT